MNSGTSGSSAPFVLLALVALLLQAGYWLSKVAAPFALAYERFTAVWLLAEGFSAFAVFVDFVVRFDHIPQKWRVLKTLLVGVICCGFLFHMLAAYLDAMQ
jgi:hypothetical protein